MSGGTRTLDRGDAMLVWGWLAVLFGGLFLSGSAVGSFLDVCICRLPRGRNLFWPSSRCGSCYTPIRITDNLPRA